MDAFEEFSEIVLCRICNEADGLMNDHIHEKDDIQAHYFCLLFSSGLGQKGKDEDGIRGFMIGDIRKEIKRGARLKCHYCHKKGATVGCAEQKCKKSFHLPCGSKNDSLQQYFDQFKAYCKEHRPTQKPGRRGGKRADKSDNICTICQDKVIRKATCKVIWSPCCSEYFHRDCIQQWAYSQGSYLFRCPHCQDEGNFGKEMQVMGIYLPVQDAIWENSTNFADIDETPPKLCHAKICFCPEEEGRAFNKEHGIWEVLACRSCGSRGIHAKCGGLEDYPDAVWDCYNCRSVMGDRKPDLLPHTEKLWTHLGSNLVSAELDPKKDALRTKSDRQRSDGGSTSSSSEGSPVYKESTSSPNKLFEALLATLPHLKEMEESMQQHLDTSSSNSQSTNSNNLQLTITPVYTHPSDTTTASNNLQFPSSIQTTTANKPLSSAAIMGVTNGTKVAFGINGEHLTNGTKNNGLSITSLPPGTANSYGPLNQKFANGIHSNNTKGKVQKPSLPTSPLVAMETDTILKIPQSLTIKPILNKTGASGDSLQSPINLSSKSDRVDISRITSKPRRSLGKVVGDRPASASANRKVSVAASLLDLDKVVDLAMLSSGGNTNSTNGSQNGNGHYVVSNGQNNIQRNGHENGHSYSSNGHSILPENGHVVESNGHNRSGLTLSGINGLKKEIYDYTLDDIIRSRLTDNGDITSTTLESKTNNYTSNTTLESAHILNGGYPTKLQVNGLNKKAPVFRILNGVDPTTQPNQRKIPQFFHNRK